MRSTKYYKKLLLVSRLIVSLVFLAGIEAVWANGELCNPEKILDRLFEDGKASGKLLGADDEDNDSVNNELLALLDDFGQKGNARISDRFEMEDCVLEFEIEIKKVQVFKITEDNETPNLREEERRKEIPLSAEEGMSLAGLVSGAMLFNNFGASAAKKQAKADGNDFIKFKTTQKGITSQIKRLLSFETPVADGDNCSKTVVIGSISFFKGFRTIVKGTNKTLKSEAIQVKVDLFGFVRCCCKSAIVDRSLSEDEVLLGDEEVPPISQPGDEFLEGPDGRLLPPLDSEDLRQAPSGIAPPPDGLGPTAPEQAPAPAPTPQAQTFLPSSTCLRASGAEVEFDPLIGTSNKLLQDAVVSDVDSSLQINTTNVDTLRVRLIDGNNNNISSVMSLRLIQIGQFSLFPRDLTGQTMRDVGGNLGELIVSVSSDSQLAIKIPKLITASGKSPERAVILIIRDPNREPEISVPSDTVPGVGLICNMPQ